MADWINEQVKSWPVQTHEPAVLDDMSSVDIVKAKVDAVRAEAMQVYKVSREPVAL